MSNGSVILVSNENEEGTLSDFLTKEFEGAVVHQYGTIEDLYVAMTKDPSLAQGTQALVVKLGVNLFHDPFLEDTPKELDALSPEKNALRKKIRSKNALHVHHDGETGAKLSGLGWASQIQNDFYKGTDVPAYIFLNGASDLPKHVNVPSTIDGAVVYNSSASTFDPAYEIIPIENVPRF